MDVWESLIEEGQGTLQETINFSHICLGSFSHNEGYIYIYGNIFIQKLRIDIQVPHFTLHPIDKSPFQKNAKQALGTLLLNFPIIFSRFCLKEN